LVGYLDAVEARWLQEIGVLFGFDLNFDDFFPELFNSHLFVLVEGQPLLEQALVLLLCEVTF